MINLQAICKAEFVLEVQKLCLLTLIYGFCIMIFRRGSRRSMMPEMLQNMITSVSETVGCRLTASKADSTATTEDDVEMEDQQEVDLKFLLT